MTKQQFQPQTQLAPVKYSTAWFETMFWAFDRLHDEVCNGRRNAISPTGPVDMAGWLEDVIYTAQETLSEIRTKIPEHTATDAELFS